MNTTEVLHKYYNELSDKFRLPSDKKAEDIILEFKNNQFDFNKPHIISPPLANKKVKNTYIFEIFSENRIIENFVISYIASLIENKPNLLMSNELCDIDEAIIQICLNITQHLTRDLALSVELINKLSQQTHEKSSCSGWLCFADKFDQRDCLAVLDTIDDTIYFSPKGKKDDPDSSVRTIRRLLETTN